MNVLCCFGDSITYGEFVSTEEIWPTLLRERFPDWRIRNRGVCGDTTRLALERWKRDVLDCHPTHLLIQFGHNDANEWDGYPRVSYEAYQANLCEMLDRARQAGIQVIALLAPWGNPVVEQYADGMKYGTDYFQIPVLRFRDLPTVDGVHPSPEGHRIYAEIVAGEVAQWAQPLITA